MKKRSKFKILTYLLALSVSILGCEKNNYKANAEISHEIDNETIVKDEEEKEHVVLNSVQEEAIKILDELEETKETTFKQKLYKVTENTIMRSNSKEEALKITEILSNSFVYKLFDTSNNYSLVSYNNTIGFLPNDVLKDTNEVVELNYEHNVKSDLAITTTNLNFRRYPSTDSEIITTFTDNLELEVLAELNNGWILVRNNGIIGYVYKEYTISLLDKLNTEYPNQQANKFEVKKIGYSTTTLNFRKDSNTDSDIIRQLSKYESVRILSSEGDWYFVMTNEYEFGYVHKDYIKDLDSTYVITDIGNQRLYIYNGEELLFTIPVTTGKDSTPTDLGLYKIYAKETDRYLVGPGYRSFVNYWMPYNGGEGLHDASWRKVFGKEDYKYNGSHGCTNIHPEQANEVYNNVEIGTKVLVHK